MKDTVNDDKPRRHCVLFEGSMFLGHIGLERGLLSNIKITEDHD